MTKKLTKQIYTRHPRALRRGWLILSLLPHASRRVSVTHMLLSILIPTYNTDCTALAKALITQCDALSLSYELIVADDGSTDKAARLANQAINTWPHARFITRSPNAGRTATCNFLAHEARGTWALICDSDMQVVRADFIAKYLAAMAQADVVLGGLQHVETQPSPKVSLRYRYEAWVTKRWPLAKRQAYPLHGMTTANILLRRTLLLRYGFDTRCQHYGYEDALLGRALALGGHRAIYIDNPLLHLGLEPNTIYLAKVETSLRTLHDLNDSAIHTYFPISRLALHLQRWHLLSIVAAIFHLLQGVWRKHLLGSKPFIPLLQAYKVAYYCHWQTKRQP